MDRKSFIDDLTGLYNRRYLRRWIKKELARCKRYNLPLSVALLDLDDFKQINDVNGHLVGDNVLIQFSEFLKEVVRAADMVVRYGGDEFIIVFPNTKKTQANAVMERIMGKIVKQNFNCHSLSASCGLSSFPEDGSDWEYLFKAADRRMYQVKRVDKGGIGLEEVFYEDLQIPTPRLIGRNKELRLCSKYTEEEETGLVVINGEAGVGKTRLVKEVNSDFTERVLFTGASYPAMSQSPYYAARDLLQELVSREEEVVREIFVEHLTLPQKRVLSSFLPDLTQGFSEASGDRLMLFDTITNFFDLISERIPIAILFDDLHWASESTMDLLHFILKSKKKWYPVFGTYRTEEIKGTPFMDKVGLMGRENLYKEVNLETLGRDLTEEMISVILTQKASQELVDFIYNESGGNPFFIEEILKEMKDSAALFKAGEYYKMDRKVDFHIPKTIADTVNHKLSILDSNSRKVCDIAALIGGDFTFSLLHSISGLNEGELYDLLDQLKDLQFLIEKEGQMYSFKEDVFRQVIEENILTGTKRKLHMDIAETIERMMNDTPKKFEQLAYHYYNAGDKSKIVRFAEKAGDNARAIYAHKEAIRFYNWSLSGEMDDEKRGEILAKIGAEAAIMGDYENAIQNYEKALDYLKDNRQRAQAYKELGNTYLDLGNYEMALAKLRDARKNYSTRQEKYSCDSNISWVYMEMGKEKSSIRSAKRTINRLDKDRFPKEYSVAYNTLASINRNRGKYDKALQLYDKARKIREKIGYRQGVGSILMNMAGVYIDLHDLPRAKRYYKKALELYRDTGFKEGEVSTLYNIGTLEMRRNNLDRTEEYMRNALDMAEWVGGIKSKVLIMSSLGIIQLIKGSIRDGLDMYMQALEEAKKTKSPDTLVSIYSRLCTVYIDYVEDFDKARYYIDKAGELLTEIDPGITQTRYYLARARYYLAEDMIDEGIDLIKQKLLPLSKEIDNLYALNRLYMLWARFYSKKGWGKWGIRYIEKAMEYADKSMDISMNADVYRAAGKFYKNLEKKERALENYEKALDLYRDIQFKWYIEDIEKDIKSLAEYN